MRSTMKSIRSAWPLAVVAVLATVQPLEGQQLDPPYSVDELKAMIASPMTEARVAQLVSEGCLDFAMDAFVIADLREAGASLDLIATLNEACVETPEVPDAADPEPAAPVVVMAPDDATETSTRSTRRFGGFYGPGSWVRLQYGSIGETQSGAISWANNGSGSFEFGLSGGGSRLVTSPGGIDTNLWNADAGMWLNLFLMNPSRNRPVGWYFGGLAGLSRSWIADGFGEGQDRIRYGWESGVFAHIGTGPIALIPRVAYQSTRVRVTGTETDPLSVSHVLVGAELFLSGVVPGVFVDLSDGETLTIIALTFAF